MTYQEDQLISVVSCALRAMSVPVLAEGGNQMRAFRFILPTGRRKAPDLAFVSEGTLFIFEAKIRASYLFMPTKDGYSDYDSMRFIAQNAHVQASLLEEARRRLDACGQQQEAVSQVMTGLMAAHPVACRLQPGDNMAAIRVDPKSHSWSLETASPSGVLERLLG